MTREEDEEILPARILFQTEAGVLSLIDWYEAGSHFDGAAPVALRFCQLVTGGQLVRRLGDVPG